MRYLWIDFWTKKVWLAIETEWFSFSHSIVSRVKIYDELKKIIKKEGITDIVVWMPFDLFWNDNDRVLKVEKFMDWIKNLFPEISLHSFDERFTSFEASNINKELWLWKTQFDDISAQIILESFLRFKK